MTLPHKSSKKEERCDSEPTVKQYTIHSLPVEILEEVMKDIPETESEEPENSAHKGLLKLSHVSAVFRQVLIAMPLLWTQIGTTFPLAMVQLFLLRSRDKPLQIIASSSPLVHGPAYTQIVSHGNRWEKLIVRDPLALFDLASLQPELKLQGLKSIDVKFTYLGAVPRGLIMPNLKEVIVDEQSAFARLPRSVERCKFTPRAVEDTTGLCEQIGALSRNPTLKELALDISGEHCARQQLYWTPRLTLAQLTRLTFRTSHSSWIGLLAATELPILQELSIELSGNRGVCFDTTKIFLGMWRRSSVSYSNLRHFKFTYHRFDWRYNEEGSIYPIYMDNGDGKHNCQFLDAILEKMPNLESLAIDASSLRPPAYDFIIHGTGINPFSTGPPLQEMEFKSCKLVSYTYLHGLLDALRDSQSWTHFRTLSTSCPDESPNRAPAAAAFTDEGYRIKSRPMGVKKLQELLEGRTLELLN